MPSDSSIKCFLSVCETLSFTETGHRLFMSQQSVSKAIARLEKELGFPLFMRTHHFVRLTRAGEEYFRLFSEFEKKSEALQEELARYYDSVLGTLNVGYLEWLGISEDIAHALKILRSEKPSVRVLGEKQDHALLSALLFDRKLDMIITYREFAPSGPGFCSMVMKKTPRVLLVSPENPLCKTAEDWTAFRKEPIIKAAGHGESAADCRARALRHSTELGFSPSDIIVAPNLESAYLSTELGQGVLISTMLSRMVQLHELRRYPLGSQEELMCCWHEDNENPLCALFARSLMKAVKETET